MLIYLEELNTMVIKKKKKKRDTFLHHWFLIPQTNALEPVRVKAPCALAADVSRGRKPLTRMKSCRYELESCGKLCPFDGKFGRGRMSSTECHVLLEGYVVRFCL